ncbi:Conserved putative membrane protein [Amycolatopsis japonica]|uniref:Conserved putative membrane protein n=1 Tax=Amycolatopsis japonica TaxID=208439 RepID=A0A075UM76_9PSEU|nr:gephyrin-like molybdotransferase receptor GlpR [Amycolatopsis japonica]AIG73674.1 Conserved putative membrane protein [Amycolatopsis japonica]
MPSSVIIVALAAAWLVVLVPMVARKRQQVARTTDSALAARVVRSGSTRHEGPEEFAMAENTEPSVEDDLAELEAELDADLEDEEPEAEPLPQPSHTARPERERQGAGYRPGRGGFDPEAADIAARAKYAFRQRVVIALLVLVVTTAAVAGFLTPTVWWANGVVDAVLIGYLAYLRRQVRIENDIRQRRLARFNNTRAPRRPAVDDEDHDAHESREDIEVVATERPAVVERKPSPMSRLRRQAVVVDLDDEDPAFHELDEPGTRPFRRAAGE